MALLSDDTKRILSLIAKITKEGVKESGWLTEKLIIILCDPYGRSGLGMIPSKIYSSIGSLDRGGYIRRTKEGGHKTVMITDKARLVLLQENIHQKNRKKWDKKWRLVIFDIPENDRRERNFLRSYLKSFGLKELQKSVWIFPYDIEKEFKEFLKLCNKRIEGDIRFITVEKISEDKDLLAFFGLI